MSESTKGYRHKFTVSPETYSGFINVFKDENPLHTDEQFAKELGFDRVVMHGNILNGFLSFFVGQCLSRKNVMIINQQIDFHKPVFLNDVVELIAKVSFASEAVGITEYKYYFENQQKEKVAKGKITVKTM